jgi:hypothetical protein
MYWPIKGRKLQEDGQNCIDDLHNLYIQPYTTRYQIKNDVTGVTYNTHVR